MMVRVGHSLTFDIGALSHASQPFIHELSKNAMLFGVASKFFFFKFIFDSGILMRPLRMRYLIYFLHVQFQVL